MKNRLTVTGFMAGVACLRSASDFPLKVSENRHGEMPEMAVSFSSLSSNPWAVSEITQILSRLEHGEAKAAEELLLLVEP